MRPFTIERLHDLLTTAPKATFFRHDVDVSPTAALSMARFERDRGIHATYYVMTTSPFYTEREALNLAVVVSALGHRVALHIDNRLADDAPPEGSLVSFHCPTPGLLWEKFETFQSAYAPVWKGRYFSDSRGRFDHGDPEDHFDGRLLQISLHPEWWFDPFFADAIDDATYERFFHEGKP